MLLTLQEHLRRIIQDSVDGHDSKEDALACLDLMKMKAVSEVRHRHYYSAHCKAGLLPTWASRTFPVCQAAKQK